MMPGSDGHSLLFQCLHRGAGQKQMEKEWMSLHVLSCNPEASRAVGGKAAVRGSAVSHGLGAGCRARKQDRLTVGCLALSMVCVDSHSCPRAL